jgi:hypothetical protein
MEGKQQHTFVGDGSGAHIEDSEIPHVFGVTEEMSGGKATADQIAISKVMTNIWATFAKDPDKGLTKLGYPLYDPNGKISHSSCLRILTDSKSRPDFDSFRRKQRPKGHICHWVQIRCYLQHSQEYFAWR